MKQRDAQSQFDRERLVSQISQLEQRIIQLESELERAHRLATLGTIAGSIAHEFNNILTPVMSYAQLALQSRDDAQLIERALTKAIEGTDRASQIASAMLGFIKDSPHAAVANVRSVVDDAISCMGRDPAKDKIDVRVDVPLDCVAAIRPLALHQVMLNLLINARKAIYPGPGRISIAVKRSTGNIGEASSWLTITMADTGRGIDPSLLPRIFDPFVTNANEEGTGLGLAICHRLISQSGGTISASSESGKGAIFTIRLPAAEAAAGREAA